MARRLVTIEDFKDIFIKLQQRGSEFLLSKLNFNAGKRTKSAFNETDINNSNFWIIPAVRKRWNNLITGNPDTGYEEYLAEKFLRNKGNIKILALGTGVRSHEIKLAECLPDAEIHCYDFSEILLKQAELNAKKLDLNNIYFHAADVLQYKFNPDYYGAVFFHASLHHFDNIPQFLDDVVIKSLRPDGMLIINEYVGNNRLQYSEEQITYINKAIQLIPRKYRKIYKTNLYKNYYYGSGVWRMKIADSSECVDSISILPAIHEKFNIFLEKSYGNNLLQSTFKDISHHFVNLNEEKREIINKIFNLEDEFLKTHSSDFVFGIYEKMK